MRRGSGEASEESSSGAVGASAEIAAFESSTCACTGANASTGALPPLRTRTRTCFTVLLLFRTSGNDEQCMQVPSDGADVVEAVAVGARVDADALDAAEPCDVPGEECDCFEEEGPLRWVFVGYLWELVGFCGFLGGSGG